MADSKCTYCDFGLKHTVCSTAVDVHHETAQKMFHTELPNTEQRRAAKSFNFFALFGAKNRGN